VYLNIARLRQSPGKTFFFQKVVHFLKAKARDSYIASLTGMKPDQPHFTIIKVAVIEVAVD